MLPALWNGWSGMTAIAVLISDLWPIVLGVIMVAGVVSGLPESVARSTNLPEFLRRKAAVDDAASERPPSNRNASE
jgi:hypothetical protein